MAVSLRRGECFRPGPHQGLSPTQETTQMRAEPSQPKFQIWALQGTKPRSSGSEVRW